MDEQIENIIRKRKSGALWGAAITSVVLTYFAFKQEIDVSVVVIIGILILIPLFVIYAVNARNYPVPLPSYRRFNKIIYVYIARIFAVIFLIEAVINLKRTFNPFENYKRPGNPSHAEYLLDTAVSGGLSYTMNKRAKSGDIVEQYFRQKENLQNEGINSQSGS